jgi:hypothetical protein
MQGTMGNANEATGFWADRWVHEAIRGDQPVTLDLPNHSVTYPDDY